MQTQKDTHLARRLDRLGVHSLDHICFSAPEIAVAQEFYDAFGLHTQQTETSLEVRTFGDSHLWIRIIRGSRKRLSYVSFGAFESDIDALATRLNQMGVELVDDRSNNSLRFRDPNGMQVEIRAAPKVMPSAKQIAVAQSSAPGERGCPMRGETGIVRPRRLAHVLFFTPDIEASIAFYVEALGLRLSDHPGPVAFLHGPHGSDHHLIAFAKSPDDIGYHHSAWDVASIDEVGLGAIQMAAAGYTRGWGLGRHVLGSNYFHYIRDPWGSYAEYSFDIDFVPADQEWEAGYPSPENSLYLWGPNVPDDFVVNYEALVPNEAERPGA